MGESIGGRDGVDTLQLEGLYLSGPITFSAANPAIAQNLAGATIVNVEQLSFRGSSGNAAPPAGTSSHRRICGGKWSRSGGKVRIKLPRLAASVV